MADFTALSTPSAEWTDFAKTWNPPKPPATATIRERQDLANVGAARLHAAVLGRPEAGLHTTDHEIPTSDGVEIAARLYRPYDSSHRPLPMYISFHGGGYFLGNLETEDPHCRQVAIGSAIAVLNVNYRHTPEWTFPAPVDDAWAAFTWAQDNSEQLGFDKEKMFVGGVSVGATLAITVALRALRQSSENVVPVRGLVLATPATVDPGHLPRNLLKDGRSSLEQNADSPFINAERLRGFASLYRPDPTSPDYSPLLLSATAFAGLCPTFIHVAGLDPLRDEGLLFEDKLKQAGVTTILYTYAGLPHAFMSLPRLPSAALYRQRLQDDLKALASRE